MRTSTGKPNKEESARIVAAKEGPCMACFVVSRDEGLCPTELGNDYHHTLSGGRRRGHMHGFSLCLWHHRGVPIDGALPSYMRFYHGPSLMDGSKPFREAYGTDQELIDLQTITIEGEF